mmetsp:Transcript_22413/g.51833  ORF Transcript_22413/g.51833 Transcript_22413/m.51833 type:complete len:331 (+) Transcript_22413:3859-4851(+)
MHKAKWDHKGDKARTAPNGPPVSGLGLPAHLRHLHLVAHLGVHALARRLTPRDNVLERRAPSRARARPPHPRLVVDVHGRLVRYGHHRCLGGGVGLGGLRLRRAAPPERADADHPNHERDAQRRARVRVRAGERGGAGDRRARSGTRVDAHFGAAVHGAAARRRPPAALLGIERKAVVVGVELVRDPTVVLTLLAPSPRWEVRVEARAPRVIFARIVGVHLEDLLAIVRTLSNLSGAVLSIACPEHVGAATPREERELRAASRRFARTRQRPNVVLTRAETAARAVAHQIKRGSDRHRLRAGAGLQHAARLIALPEPPAAVLLVLEPRRA